VRVLDWVLRRKRPVVEPITGIPISVLRKMQEQLPHPVLGLPYDKSMLLMRHIESVSAATQFFNCIHTYKNPEFALKVSSGHLVGGPWS